MQRRLTYALFAESLTVITGTRKLNGQDVCNALSRLVGVILNRRNHLVDLNKDRRII
jgi:hypothetical protein